MNNCKRRGDRLAWRRRGFVLAFLAPTLIAFCIFYLYPLLTLVYTSFCKWDYTNMRSPQFWGVEKLFDNYRYIFEIYPYFWEALGNSVKWALIGIFFQTPFSAMMAFTFSRKIRGVGVIRNVYIVPCMISSAAMGMIFLQLYSPLYGIVNPVIRLFVPGFRENVLLLRGPAFWAMTGAYVFFTGTTTLMLLGSINAVPEEIREAALIDGVSGIRQDLWVVLPMIRGALKVVSILAATSGFLLYNEVFFLTRGAAGTYSVSYVIRELAITSPRTQFGRANSVAMIQIVAGILIIVFVNLLYDLPDKRKERRAGRRVLS